MRRLISILFVFSCVISFGQTINPLTDSIFQVTIIKRVKPIDTSRIFVHDTVKIAIHDTTKVFIHDTVIVQGPTVIIHDTIYLNIPPANQPPNVTAGSNQTIKLPVNSVTLSGIASDPDGTIVSYLWEKVSGGAATIVTPKQASTAINGLVQGSYQFKLTVTDNQGATAFATVNIVVQPADTQTTTNTGTASVAPTYESAGLYWTGHGRTISDTVWVKYRVQGASAWTQGFWNLLDTRATGNRPANEYRVSIVGITSETTYEYQLTAGTASYSGTFTTKTESNHLPIASTTTLNSASNITSGGTATGWKVYTGTITGGSNNLYINAPYTIFRGMTLTGATNDAIVLGPNAHDVIIENCDISGWGQSASTLGGNNQAGVRVSGFSYNASNVSNITIQRCKIHDPRYTASAWDAGNTHAYGVNGINFEAAGTGQVIRYNEIVGSYTDPSKHFMDGIGGADNFTTTGFPNANSDIYGNRVEQVYDDGIESEGGDCNVRIWGNFLNNTFTGISCATNSVGPLYIFSNITNVGQRLVYGTAPATLDVEDRGPFNKCGSQDATVRGGRTFLFHNTILQPLQAGYKNPRGLDGGIVDNGGPVTDVFSANNIWTSAYTGKGGLPIAMWQGGGQRCYSYNDFLSPNSTNGTFSINNRITGTPQYVNQITLTLNTSGYYLVPGSTGQGKAMYLPGFNQPNDDLGAQQTRNKPLQFGVQ